MHIRGACYLCAGKTCSASVWLLLPQHRKHTVRSGSTVTSIITTSDTANTMATQKGMFTGSDTPHECCANQTFTNLTKEIVLLAMNQLHGEHKHQIGIIAYGFVYMYSALNALTLCFVKSEAWNVAHHTGIQQCGCKCTLTCS